jgi:hypothetical protein
VQGAGNPTALTNGRRNETGGKLLSEQLAYMKSSRALIFAWIGGTSLLAAFPPVETDSLAWLSIVMACALGPVAAFLIAWRSSPALRARMLSIDIGVVTLFKSARILGLAFIVAYSYDKLPAGFAFWAGGIDFIVGGTALTAAYTLTAIRPFPKRALRSWHLFGMFDFVVALPLIVLFSPTELGVLAGSGPTTQAALEFPLSFITMAGVPIMWCTHLVALFHLRHHDEPLAYPLLHPIRGEADRGVELTQSQSKRALKRA